MLSGKDTSAVWLAGPAFSVCPREFNCLSWEEREKINYLTEEEKFLFRIFITADLEKLNKKTNKQYEGYGSAVKTGYSFLKKKILYWFA